MKTENSEKLSILPPTSLYNVATIEMAMNDYKL